MPPRPSRYFTGRRTLLDKLAFGLEPREQGPAIVALHGLDGVGKTEVALAYWQRHGSRYDTMEWIRASSGSLLAGECQRIADELSGSAPLGKAGDVVRALFEDRPDWLLVFDDVPEPEALDGYLPRTGSGSVLITSRYAAWRSRGEPLPVAPFGRDEAIEFLCASTDQRDTDAADGIAEELGGLPLALEQAAAHVLDRGITLGRYAELLRADLAATLSLGDQDADAGTIAGVWSASLQSIRTTSPTAYDLLRLLSFIVPEQLDQARLRPAARLLDPTRDDLSDAGLLHRLLAVLRRHSLVEANPADTVTVHRLVKAVVRARMTGDERRRWAGTAHRLVGAAHLVDIEREDG